MFMGEKRTIFGGGMSRFLCLGIFALCLLMAFPVSAAPLSVDVQPKAGYSRIVLESNKPLIYDARIENSVLGVTF